MINDAEQIIIYFSGFLQQIHNIVANIKSYLFEMVDLTLPVKQVSVVYQSMPSIVLSTHKIFDDLKKVQSMLTGIIKSKRIIRNIDQQNKVLSEHQFYSPKIQKIGQHIPCAANLFKQASKQEKNEQKTIKRDGSSMNNKIEKQFGLYKNNQYDTVKQSKKKMFRKKTKVRKVEQQNNDESYTKGQLGNVEQHLRAIIKMNKSSLQHILVSNDDCLRLVKSMRKTFKSK